MPTTTKVIVIVLIVLAILSAGVYVYFNYFFQEPDYVKITDTIAGVTIQPAEALQIADPYLAEHGTYVYKEDEALQTHIVRYKDWYFVSRTNYPAKYAGYYTKRAVKVHVDTGEVSFTDTERLSCVPDGQACPDNCDRASCERTCCSGQFHSVDCCPEDADGEDIHCDCPVDYVCGSGAQTE